MPIFFIILHPFMAEYQNPEVMHFRIVQV